MANSYIGIDVQVGRGFACMALNDDGRLIDSLWSSSPNEIHSWVQGWARRSDGVAIGVDSPKRGLPRPRNWYWEGKRRSWRRRKPTEKGIGRHAEVIIAAHRIANPQWTPLREDAPKWMRMGFECFAALQEFDPVEVFPTASYRMLSGVEAPLVSIHFADFADGPKDMLDACIGAVTVAEYEAGRGESIGGGDDAGTIVLPRPLSQPRIEEVFRWPKEIGKASERTALGSDAGGNDGS